MLSVIRLKTEGEKVLSEVDGEEMICSKVKVMSVIYILMLYCFWETLRVRWVQQRHVQTQLVVKLQEMQQQSSTISHVSAWFGLVNGTG